MVVGKDKVITISYQLFSLNDNQDPILIEERIVDDPLEFLYGNGEVLSKVEEAINGQSRGFHKEIDLHPHDAFGLHNSGLVAWMEKSKFPKDLSLEMGMKFQTQGPEGDVISVIIKQIDEDKVLVDGNHPLAGLHLRFDLKILRVRDATEEEIASGEVKPTALH